MTKKQKQLLVKALCGYLPYGVKGLALGGRVDTISTLVPGEYPWVKTDTGLICRLGTGQFKPYLRPMSSMTEEEDTRRCAFLDDIEGGVAEAIPNYIDWFNEHRFDYRGLIDMGLAIEAPNEMYGKKLG